LPVHADHIARDSGQFAALILPNLGALSDPHIAAIRAFVARGGGLLATGSSSLCNEWGDSRPDFALADLFGAHVDDRVGARDFSQRLRQATDTAHTYLRISPERRALVNGPQTGTEPAVTGQRHSVLQGFEATDILPFGGVLEPLRVDQGTLVPLTFVPAFPIYPPETAWMREPKTDLPGLMLRTTSGGARVAYLPADLDRRFARDNLPDHGDLLANIIRWIIMDQIPLSVEGPGLIDCHLYRQANRLILHLVNLTSAGSWRQPVHELIPIGSLTVKLQLPANAGPRRARLLVADRSFAAKRNAGWARVIVPSILDHEVLVLEW
jgi:hypothetical protein